MVLLSVSILSMHCVCKCSCGATMYNSMLSAITDTPNTNNSNSELLSARVIIESEEIIGVMNNFTASLNAGFCLSQSAIVGENK